MLGERTAAPLSLRNDDFATFGGEDPRGGLVDTSEEHTLDASEQQCDPLALLPLGRNARR
jgi:hypothetical protein